MRRGPAALLLAAVLAASTACSLGSAEPTREYAIPNPLCGVELPERLYEPLYPPGGAVEIALDFDDGPTAEYVDPVGECLVNVDGSSAVYVFAHPTLTGDRWEGFGPFLRVMPEHRGMSGADTFTSGTREVAVWPDLVAVRIPCAASPDSGLASVNLAIRLDWAEDGPDRREELRELIGPYADAYLARLAPGTCEAA
ncbi:hypothetical protein D7231_34975 [Streptomyces klenkii]|uniref:DUF3558 domain-containing protein n=1 Tax=Streptomyces klenkii TaxID=1420899 RepID=A0A3B0A2M7_9ACTN|nr:hypothetical protein [Streptomyces klenkii]RKN54825.1 hypothetical protein D7231_34975 [Streptomyces klenkii]